MSTSPPTAALSLPPTQTTQPLIVTAGIDAEAQRHLDGLRQRYFPPGRTVLGAHLTLFHAIPESEREGLFDLAHALCAQIAPFSAALAGLYSLGRGVAVRVDSPPLRTLREGLAQPLRSLLTPQDAQPFRPHITLANKLPGPEAKEALARLRTEFIPATFGVDALVIWRYLGPQWRLEGRFPLTGARLATR